MRSDFLKSVPKCPKQGFEKGPLQGRHVSRILNFNGAQQSWIKVRVKD